MSMDGVTTFKNIFHSSKKVEQNCTFWSTHVLHAAGTKRYHFLLISCCTPSVELPKVPKIHL